MDILYKTTGDDRFIQLSDEAVKDIALEEVIDYMTGDTDERKVLRDIMSKLPRDPADMIYRQDIVKDFLANENLYTKIKEIITSIKVLQLYGGGAKRVRDNDHSLTALLDTLRELKVYVDVVEGLYNALSGCDIKSEGLIGFREELRTITEDEEFRSVKPDILTIQDDLSIARGAVIGVSLTPDMDIENVTAIEFVDCKPRSKYNIMDVAIGAMASSPHNRIKQQDPLLVAMTPHLKKHLWKQMGEIKRLIVKHSKYDTRLLTNLYNSLIYYLRITELGRKLASQGYVTSFPSITSDKSLEIKGLYNIRLAIKSMKDIVKNDFAFTDKERLFILTGPNRGGKTILEQSLGLISVMASLGMFICADSMTGLPFGNILTHFPIDENLTINYGRLGEEAVRIKEIVRHADDNTLILFNETFSTTSAADALYLSKDLIHILKEKGASVIFNTHIHELAACIPEMDEWDGTSNIISLVMEIKDNKNTFRIKRSEPDTSSYARNIAEKYGITYEQMKEG